MWELDYKESWAPKNWCFCTVVLEKTLESPLDCTEIQPLHPKGDQCWVFIGRTDVEAETPILWPPDVKSWLIRKYPDAGRDWGQEEKGTTEDEMVGWHHRLNAHGFGWTPGVGDGQGGLACCSSWGHKQTWLSDWTELNWIYKGIKPDYVLIPYTKINSRVVKDPNVRPQSIKLLEENIGSMVFDINLKKFLELSPQAKETKAKINK